MTEPKVLIGTGLPSDWRIDLRTAGWCFREVNFGVGWKWQAEAVGGNDDNKNIITTKFPEEDFTDLFFINNDTWLPPNTINKLLAHDKDIVGVLTPMYHGSRGWMGQKEKDKYLTVLDCPKKLFQAARAGGPGMLIKRKVIEAMKWPYWESKVLEDGKQQSEDYLFCDLAIKLGFEVWIDPAFQCMHMHITNMLEVFKGN